MRAKNRPAVRASGLRPGIIGLAQVQGIGMSDPEKLAARDAEYLRSRSLALDEEITLETLAYGRRQ